MKMRNIILFIITIITCVACSSVNYKSSNEFRLTLLKSTLNNSAIENFAIVVKADSVQTVSNSGLKFSLKISNTSTSNATVVNPIDLFGLSLSNEKGMNILFPYVSRVFIHSAPQRKYSFDAFNILKVIVNGKQSNDRLEEIQQIEIPGNGSYEIFFSITKSLKPDATKPYMVEETVLLPKGRYTLFITQSIQLGSKSGMFNTSVPIKYGQ